MKILITCVAFVSLMLVLNAQDTPPKFSETFMSNLTVHAHEPNSTGNRGWMTQDSQKQMYALTIEIPKSDRMPQGGVYREVSYSSREFRFISSDTSMCECENRPFYAHWWWVADSKKVDEPPPDNNLLCWEEDNGHGRDSHTVCVKPDNPDVPFREFRFQIHPNVHYLEFSQYVSDKVNMTMFDKIPDACQSNCK